MLNHSDHLQEKDKREFGFVSDFTGPCIYIYIYIE